MFIKKKAQPGDILTYTARKNDLIGGIISFFSDIGRKQTNTVHVGVYAGNNKIVHSHLRVDPKYYIEGNRISGCHMAFIPPKDYELISIHRVPYMTPQIANKVLNWMQSKYLSEYDIESFSEIWYRSVFARLLGWKSLMQGKPDDNSNDPNRLNCSEYVANAFKEAVNINIRRDLHPSNYTPADFISGNTILRKIA